MTIWLFTVIAVMSLDRRSMVRSMSVTRRPNEAALVTGLPSITQLYAWWVWPLITASTWSSRRFTMSTIGPVMPVQPL